MGRLSSICVVVPLLAGCGRLGFGELEPGFVEEPGSNTTAGVDDTSSRAPLECESVAAFANTAVPDVDLSVATTPTGASLFWVRKSGSSLRGIDLALNRTASAATTVRTGSYTGTAATYIDGALLATGMVTARAVVHTVPQPIAAGTEIGNFGGDHMSKGMPVHAGGDRVMATSCSELMLHRFDATWTGFENTLTSMSDVSDHIDIVAVASQALAVVSTASMCQYETVIDANSGVARTSPALCAAARLASAGNEVLMALENGSSVDVVTDDASTVTAANATSIALGSSPRVLRHDGRYWVTYLDETSRIVFGYIDENGMLLTRDSTLSANHDAYELGVFDNQPWLFAVDPATSGVSARRLCVPQG